MDANYTEADASEWNKRQRKPKANVACDVCGKSFSKAANLKQHKLLHFENNEKSECDVCQKSFRRADLLKRHKRNVHCEQTKRTCEVCDTVYKSKSSLEIHARTHKVPTFYECDGCKYKFTAKYSLKFHIENKYCKKFKTKKRMQEDNFPHSALKAACADPSTGTNKRLFNDQSSPVEFPNAESAPSSQESLSSDESITLHLSFLESSQSSTV